MPIIFASSLLMLPGLEAEVLTAQETEQLAPGRLLRLEGFDRALFQVTLSPPSSINIITIIKYNFKIYLRIMI